MNPNPMNHGRFVGNWQQPQQPPAYQQPSYQPNAQQSYDAFKALNPHLFNQPQTRATFGGQAMGWTGGQPLKAGSTLPNGAFVASGTGNSLNAPAPIHTAYGGPGPQGQQPQGQPQSPLAQAYGNLPGFGGAQGGSNFFDQIPGMIQKQQDEANAANEQRYQQLLGNNQQDTQQLLGALGTGWNSLIGQSGKDKQEVLGAMNGGWDKIIGLAGQDSTKAAIGREERLRQSQLGANAQSLVNRGLTNSTILDSTNRGIEDDSALRKQGIYDAATQRELATREAAISQQVPTLMGLNQNTQNLGIGQLQQLIPSLMHQNDSRQNIIENRTDQGPNTALWTSLLQQAGANQNAQLQAQLQMAQLQQQNQSGNMYNQLLSQIMGQMPTQYARPVGQVKNGPGNNAGFGGWKRPNQGGDFPGGSAYTPGGNAPAGGAQAGAGAGNIFGGQSGQTPWGTNTLPNGQPMPAGAANGGDPYLTDLAPDQSGFFGGPPQMAGPDTTNYDQWLQQLLGQYGNGYIG